MTAGEGSQLHATLHATGGTTALWLGVSTVGAMSPAGGATERLASIERIDMSLLRLRSVN